MIEVLAIFAGVLLVVSVLCDMVNTLVSTNTSSWKWWLSRRVTIFTWRVIRFIALRMPDGAVRERLLSTYAPVLVLGLLITWVTQQIIGFGLIWWGLGNVSGVETLADSLYYSGVVFFTVGFGEVVPSGTVPRFGALIEAFSGVLTTALVIGYLPALYSAYSEREQKIMTLDDGGNGRITPTNLVMAWAPTGDPDDLVSRFASWEDWTANVLETHTTFPMLQLFRSHHAGQNWITALGLVSDAALHCELIVGARRRAPYFMLRRAIRLFGELTEDVDLSRYRADFDATYGSSEQFRELYDALEAHGFELIPFEEGRLATLELRRTFDAPLEYLIDARLAPRGFWGHEVATAAAGLASADDASLTKRVD